MTVHFFKYHGTGNDFVLADNRDGRYSHLSAQQIKKICTRRFGVGADGLMLLNNADGYDFEMLYYNADGWPGTMCGNGGRCMVRFAADMGISTQQYRFLAPDGAHEAALDESGVVTLKMQDVKEITRLNEDFVLNTGSPHFIRIVPDARSIDVVSEGKKIRYRDAFEKEGINVNFVEVINKHSVFVRTYERGVEDETLSCGTGVTAAALVNCYNPNGNNVVNIGTPGGELQVNFQHRQNHGFQNIWLKGTAVKVFEGDIEI